jgi:dolichol-phosphate mannosyltransferase
MNRTIAGMSCTIGKNSIKVGTASSEVDSLKGGGTIDYPWTKLVLNRLANKFLQFLFNIGLNDTTKAFKAYRKTVIDGCRPLTAPHFNRTVEIPLKAIVGGYSWTIIPITWRNRRTGIPKLKIKEMGAATCLFACTSGWKSSSAGATTQSPPPFLYRALNR